MNTKMAEMVSESVLVLRHQIADLDALYRKSPNGLAVLDGKQRFVCANDALAAFLCVPAESLIGRTFCETLHHLPADSAAQILQIRQINEPLMNIEVAIPNTATQNEIRYFLLHLYPLDSQDERRPHTGMVMVDVTERKLATEAMRLSEARYREMVEHAVYGVCIVGGDGCASSANASMVRILGCSTPEELVALNFTRDVFRYPDQQAQLFATCREQGSVQNAEAEWRRRDGGFVAVRMHLRRVARLGEAQMVEIIAEDVTELRALERQLQHAQKFEAIGQLAGGIAHDFNNVIGAIIGWAELGYEQNKTNGKIADRFSKIREQADRAASLTRELLAFARKQVLQPRSIDLNQVVNGLVTFLDRVIGKDISLEVNLSPLDAIKADPTRVEQVVMNLCLNARDAMPDGGRLLIESGMVEVDESYTRFYPGVVAGRYAALSVSDSGSGMDAKTLERIFEPFFTTKEQGKGTGLGLATVYGIVKQHGGFLHVYSEPGQGSLFRIYLPAMPGSAAETVQVAAPTIQEMRGTETILLAEDHESIREMARQALGSLGYRILSAANGEEALQLCEQQTPQIAVLDVVMPRLGGSATAEKLLERFPGLPVIFTSGYSRERDERTATLAQALYLQKPYSPTSLGRLIREVLDGRESQAS